MKYIAILCFFCFGPLLLRAQLVSTDPPIPIDSNPVKIIFDATKGTGGLQGFTGDVYAHTGVITDKSNSGSDWKYVKTSWGQNTTDTKLNRVGNDLYELVISPSIRQYYGVPSNEKIVQMAFVFRSADTSLEGKGDGGTDIFIDVFTLGFIVQIDRPEDNTIILPGESVSFTVSTTEETNIQLLLNDLVVSDTNGISLSYMHTFPDAGNYWVIAVADNGQEIKRDSVFVSVKQSVILATKPQQYKKGVNYIDDNTVALVLWAPYKEYVFVLGDFNGWRPDNDFQMKKDGDFFWLEINNLQPGQQYIYQYYIDGTLLIADPYTEQVSDPWNDKNISGETYPGLVAYPFQKTHGLAAVLQTGQPAYPWEVPDFTPVEKEKLIIYELHVRDFQEDHSYAAVIDKLDYLDSLGITALELMPVNEFEGNSSWGYNPSFYFAPDKYYGPKNELKRLVDECHKRGIAVLIDLVLNHSYGQSPFAQMYMEGGRPSLENPWYNREHNFTNPDAHWGFDFNHESPATQALVDSINSFWMSEYKIDGFRFDFTKGFSNNIKTNSDPWGSKYDADRIRILKRMTDEIRKRNPDAIVCFEHLSDNTEEKVLADYGIMMWGNMNYNYGEAAMGYTDSGKSNLNWGLYTSRGWAEPSLITYMESHDEERLMYKLSKWGNSSGAYNTKDPIVASHRIGLNSLFFFPLPGAKMIWQFEELGYDISIDYGCRVCEKPILWQYYEEWQRKNIYRFMSNMIHLKMTYDEFTPTSFSHSLAGPVKSYQLENNGEYVVAIGNFSVINKNTNVVFPKLGTWYEFFGKTSFEATSTNTQMTLKPGEYKLFSTREFAWKLPMSPVSTEEVLAFKTAKIKIYPNPADTEINFDKFFETIRIYDVNGQKILDKTFAGGVKSVFIDILPTGIYMVKLMDLKKGISTGYFIKQ